AVARAPAEFVRSRVDVAARLLRARLVVELFAVLRALVPGAAPLPAAVGLLPLDAGALRLVSAVQVPPADVRVLRYALVFAGQGRASYFPAPAASALLC